MKIKKRLFIYIFFSSLGIILFTIPLNIYINNNIILKDYNFSVSTSKNNIDLTISKDYIKQNVFFESLININDDFFNFNKEIKLKENPIYDNYFYKEGIDKIFILNSHKELVSLINSNLILKEIEKEEKEKYSYIEDYVFEYLTKYELLAEKNSNKNLIFFQLENYKIYTYYVYPFFNKKDTEYYIVIFKIDGIIWGKKLLKYENYQLQFSLNKNENISKKTTKSYKNIFVEFPLNSPKDEIIGKLFLIKPWEKYNSVFKIKLYMNIFIIGGISIFMILAFIILYLQVLMPITIIQNVLETGKLELFYNLKYLSDEINSIIKLIINFFEQKQILKNEIEEREYISLMLKQSEERYKTLIYNLPDSICVITKGKIVFANDKIYDLFKIDKENFFRIDLLNFIHIDDKKIFEEILIKYSNSQNQNSNNYNINNYKLDEPNLIPNPFELKIIDSKNVLKFCLLYHFEIEFNNQKSLMLSFTDISKIKQIEKEILISKNRLNSMINNIPFLAWMKDPNGVFVEVNDSFCNFYNKKREEIIGKTEFDLVSQEKAHKYNETDLETLISKKRIAYEIIEKIGESERWIEVFKNPILDDFGNPIGTIGLARDITEKKIIENQLKESEQKFREIAENLDEAIWITNNSKITYASPGFNNILEENIFLDDLNIESLILFIDKNQKNDILKSYKHFINSNNEKLDTEVKIITTNNKIKWIWLRLIKLTKNGDKILGIAEDITKKKEDEKKLQDALKETEKVNRELIKLNEELAKEINEREKARNILRKYEFIVNTSQELMALINKNYVYEAVNDYFCKVFELKREEVIGKTISQIWGEDIFENIIKPRVEDALKGISNSYNEWISLGKLGNRFVSSTYYPFYDLENNINEVVIIYHDITELKEYSDKLQDLNLNLERMVQESVEDIRKKDQLIIHQSRLAAMGEMIGNIAHQWRQPLNSLALLIQNIKDAYDYNELSKEFMEKAEKQALKLIEHMSHTIDDFRNFFKPDKQKILFSVKESINRVLDIVSATFDNHRISVFLESNEDLYIEGYPNEFGQVILNLLTNAKDLFIEKKIQQPYVKIKLYKENDNKIIEVIDNGGGFSETVLKNLFQPYFTTKEHGTGIGLYMSKYIIEKNMNGKIIAFNKDEGACFKIIF